MEQVSADKKIGHHESESLAFDIRQSAITNPASASLFN